jgi:hypothetical protein
MVRFAGADRAGELIEAVAVFDFGFVVFEAVVELGEVDCETMLALDSEIGQSW